MTDADIAEYIRNNLRVTVNLEKGDQYYAASSSQQVKVLVNLYLGDEKISSDYDVITIDSA